MEWRPSDVQVSFMYHLTLSKLFLRKYVDCFSTSWKFVTLCTVKLFFINTFINVKNCYSANYSSEKMFTLSAHASHQPLVKDKVFAMNYNLHK